MMRKLPPPPDDWCLTMTRPDVMSEPIAVRTDADGSVTVFLPPPFLTIVQNDQ
jgi:hypothetical protein